MYKMIYKQRSQLGLSLVVQGSASDRGHSIHELGAEEHIRIVEHAVLQRHNDKL